MLSQLFQNEVHYVMTYNILIDLLIDTVKNMRTFTFTFKVF